MWPSSLDQFFEGRPSRSAVSVFSIGRTFLRGSKDGGGVLSGETALSADRGVLRGRLAGRPRVPAETLRAPGWSQDRSQARRQLCHIVARSFTGATTDGYANGLKRFLEKQGYGGPRASGSRPALRIPWPGGAPVPLPTSGRPWPPVDPHAPLLRRRAARETPGRCRRAGFGLQRLEHLRAIA